MVCVREWCVTALFVCECMACVCVCVCVCVYGVGVHDACVDGV